MLRNALAIALSLSSLLFLTGFVAAADIRVAVSIKPVHSLVGGVMAGVATPDLIVRGTSSAHGASLKPSDVKKLSRASLVVWIGPSLERFMTKPLRIHSKPENILTLAALSDLTLYDNRQSGAFRSDHHESHAHDHGYKHGEKASLDSHIWLDPMNAIIFVSEISRRLSEIDPANRQAYLKNGAGLRDRLKGLMADVSAKMLVIKDKRFIVFHDAFQYFERRFGLTSAGSLTLDPEIPPGARKVAELTRKIRQSGVSCVFSEPQFNSAHFAALSGQEGVRHGMLDPLGATLSVGSDQYFRLIENMTKTFFNCLSRK